MCWFCIEQVLRNFSMEERFNRIESIHRLFGFAAFDYLFLTFVKFNIRTTVNTGWLKIGFWAVLSHLEHHKAALFRVTIQRLNLVALSLSIICNITVISGCSIIELPFFDHGTSSGC